MELKDETILIADGTKDRNGNEYDIKNIALPTTPVNVLRNFDEAQVLGTAIPRVEGDRILANFKITDKETIEVLRSGEPKIYPATGCLISGKKLRLLSIGCSVNENADPRIPELNSKSA